MTGRKYADGDPLIDPATGKLNQPEFRRRLKGWLAVALAFGVLLAGTGFVALKGYEFYQSFKTAKDFPGPGGADVQIVIPNNSTALKVGNILVEGGVVKDAKTFQDTAQSHNDLWSKVQAGKYKLSTAVPSLTALQQLVDPSRAQRTILKLREAQRVDPQQIKAIASGTGLSTKTVKAYLSSTPPTYTGLPAWAPDPSNQTAVAYEGFLFPDTYQISDKPTAREVVRTAARQFTKITKKVDFYNLAQKINYGPAYSKATPAQKAYLALIVASIIEREVYRSEDRPKVARVIYNRLAKGMKLELDSTVAYSVNKTNTIWTSSADRSAKNTSPYNTYQVAALPPTPISAPAEAALTAAVKPSEGDWLYFVPINLDTGETAFTSDLKAHEAATAQLQAWCNASPENKKKCA